MNGMKMSGWEKEEEEERDGHNLEKTQSEGGKGNNTEFKGCLKGSVGRGVRKR